MNLGFTQKENICLSSTSAYVNTVVLVVTRKRGEEDETYDT